MEIRSIEYTDKMMDYLENLRNKGTPWIKVARLFNAKFGKKKAWDSLRKALYKHRISQSIGHEDADIKLMQHNRTVRATNSRLRKEANVSLDAISAREDLLKEIEGALLKWSIEPIPQHKPTHSKGRKHAIMELMVSDTHFGQKTKVFNSEVAVKRLDEVVAVFLRELDLTTERYNLDKIIVALLGDMIASYEFHGLQSAVTCNMVTPPQIVKAIEALFWHVIRPIAATGHKIEIPAVCGNHDRVAKERPMNEPGNESISWVIYNTLEMLSRMAKLDNVKFIIPTKSHCVLDIFGYNVLYEHMIGKLDRKSAEDKVNSRQSQLKKIITFFRFGHFHEYTCFGRGRSICNASLVGPDGFSTELGFQSEAGQALNVYVNTDKRETPFYYGYLISVQNIK